MSWYLDFEDYTTQIELQYKNDYTDLFVALPNSNSVVVCQDLENLDVFNWDNEIENLLRINMPNSFIGFYLDVAAQAIYTFLEVENTVRTDITNLTNP